MASEFGKEAGDEDWGWQVHGSFRDWIFSRVAGGRQASAGVAFGG
jgi:hypothetical protein